MMKLLIKTKNQLKLLTLYTKTMYISSYRERIQSSKVTQSMQQ